MDDLTMLTASQAAEALQRKQIHSIDLVNALLERIAQENPAINAIVTLDAEGARLQAKAADEALRRGEPGGPLRAKRT